MRGALRWRGRSSRMLRCCVLAGLTAASHLNGRICEHAQIPNPDAARGCVTRAAQTAASAAAGASSSCRHHRCLPQHTHLRSTAPVATLKASYLFQSQHSTYSKLRKARAFLFKMLGGQTPRRDAPALSRCTAASVCPMRTSCRRRPRCSGVRSTDSWVRPCRSRRQEEEGGRM